MGQILHFSAKTTPRRTSQFYESLPSTCSGQPARTSPSAANENAPAGTRTSPEQSSVKCDSPVLIIPPPSQSSLNQYDRKMVLFVHIAVATGRRFNRPA